MSELLPGMEGEARSAALSQWYTPAWLADRVAGWAVALEAPTFVLEPAAGQGALIKALDIWVETTVNAVDIDAANVRSLRSLKLTQTALNVYEGNFLSGHWYDADEFDLALMNPPYEDGQDVAFIDAALDCSERVVGIFQSRIVHSQGRARFWRGVDITRMAILSGRPDFGGDHSAKTDFVVLELVRRQFARNQGEATPAAVEWW